MVSPLYKAIGTAIKGARLKRGLSQEDLARIVQLTRTSITNLESGKQQVPLHTLYEIAVAVQRDVRDLLPADIPKSAAANVRRRGCRPLGEPAPAERGPATAGMTPRAEKAARQLLAQCGITKAPVPIEDLAQHAGTEVRYRNFDGDIAGLLLRTDEATVVGVHAQHTRTSDSASPSHTSSGTSFYTADDPPSLSTCIGRLASTSATARRP